MLWVGKPFALDKMGATRSTSGPSWWVTIKFIWQNLRGLPTVISFVKTYDPRGSHQGHLSKIHAELTRNLSSAWLIAYCYGAPIAIDNADEKIKSIFIAHPSVITPQDIIDCKYPLSMAYPEYDMGFDSNKVKKVSQAKTADPNYEGVIYSGFRSCSIMVIRSRTGSGLQHGFAARPEPSCERAMQGFDKALQQAVSWVLNHSS